MDETLSPKADVRPRSNAAISLVKPSLRLFFLTLWLLRHHPCFSPLVATGKTYLPLRHASVNAAFHLKRQACEGRLQIRPIQPAADFKLGRFALRITFALKLRNAESVLCIVLCAFLQ